MKNVNDIVQQQAEDTLKKLGVADVVSASYIADSIVHQNAYWEQPLPDTKKLLFIRFFTPVVQREEVFLGNVLFNAFLSKAFTRAIATERLGGAELVANDLENHYFLVKTTSDMAQLSAAFRNEVERSLPDLFFGNADEERGIYGKLERMFTFRKSDFEPFPVYAIPQFLAPELQKAVRKELRKLLKPDAFARRFRTVLATLAFFYGRTSGGAGDAQSFPNFIDHLVNDTDYDGLLTVEDVRRVLNIETAEKPAIKKSIDDGTYNPEGLRKLLSNLVAAFHASIDSGQSKWLMGFLYKDQKFLSYSRSDYLDLLLANVQIGYNLFSSTTTDGERIICRLSGTASADVVDRYVTIGTNAFRFHNQSVKQQAEKMSAQCALYSYLAQKLLGTEMVSAGGKLPQVPKTYNIIFHYGHLDDDAIKQVAHQLDLIWNLVWQHRNTGGIRRDVDKQRRDLEEKFDRAKGAKKKKELLQQLIQKKAELDQANTEIVTVEDEILRNCPWWKGMDFSPAPAENPSLNTLASSQEFRQREQNEVEHYSIDEDNVRSICPWWKGEGTRSLSHGSVSPSLETLVNIQSSDSKFERHVLGLGMGGYRMILFVLPQIRRPRDAKEHDFAQRRFSNSRVTVTAMLSFLRELCKSEGAFYYQSLPTLTPEAFSSDTFYISNQPISVDQAQQEYEAVTQLAWKLIWQGGSSGLVKKVVLAEKLLSEPLGTFSSIMRDSPILGQTTSSYKRLRGQYRSDWGAYDLTEYTKFIQRLSKLQEGNSMALQIDREKLDEFCPKLFRLLDSFGHLPLSLRAKPNEFEKYPRSLFGKIQRNQDSEGTRDVEAGFREWENTVLRRSPYLQEEDYLDYIEDLRTWMVGNQEVFTKSANMQHLKSSLYARVFQYVYPRRVLANTYCQKHRGNVDAIKAEVLNQQFPTSIEPEVQKLKETYADDWEAIVADVYKNLMIKPYYRRVLRDEVKTD